MKHVGPGSELTPVFDKQEPLGIDESDISSIDPPIFVDRFARSLCTSSAYIRCEGKERTLVVVIAFHDLRSSYQQQSDLAGRQWFTGFGMDDGEVRDGYGRAAVPSASACAVLDGPTCCLAVV